ncbi:HIRAN domain-containing protein [Lysinibacillus sp. NPDC096418]|uniref:HIRAN domain-containing protein n=1 Tax=Lysinibacillus sp. NPDC096418 TaxID=3364138 RepID=UPI003800A168
MFFLKSKKVMEENERLSKQLCEVQQTNKRLAKQLNDLSLKEDEYKNSYEKLKSENEVLRKRVEQDQTLELSLKLKEITAQIASLQKENKNLQELLVQKNEQTSLKSDSKTKLVSQGTFTYTYKAAGVTKDNRQNLVRALQKGAKIRIVREKNNPHDPYAVALMNQYGSKVGYIPKSESEKIATILDSGVKLFGYVAQVHGGQKSAPYHGFSVDVTNKWRSDAVVSHGNATPYPVGDTSGILMESMKRDLEAEVYDFHDDYHEIEPDVEYGLRYDPDEDEWK